MANRQRGKESLGFFDSNQNIHKVGDDPMDVLGTADCTEFLNQAENDAWFIVGHTRYSTRGIVSDENSHPFHYGDVIGSHNGIVEAPMEYNVDSEYAIDLLSQNESDYQAALHDVWGYWTLAWHDARKNELFISMYDNTCGLAKYRGCWYFSSDPDHLATAMGEVEVIVLENKSTVSFGPDGNLKWRKKYAPSISYSYKKNSRTSGGSSSSSGYTSSGYTSTYESSWTQEDSNASAFSDPSSQVKDFDDEFRQLWDQYAKEYDAI